ncbi:MAG: phosphopentomutase [Saccharofermentans sp.]|nr:phosphopentomutase [Saccharofermentans sp.]
MAKRVFLVVLDSFGTGIAPDAASFGDRGSNTLAAVLSDSYKPFPNMSRMGLFDIDGLYDARIRDYLANVEEMPPVMGSYGIVREVSSGKDSTIGHWEISGIMSAVPQPTYPDGFPDYVLDEIRKISGRDILCNKPYSGTEVIKDYGKEHMETGALIVYTSADSVLQIAAHEDIVPLEELYDICAKTRAFMTGADNVGRVIARPFTGEEGNFTRTARRHDFSAEPPSSSMMEILKGYGFETISVGKINDLFAGRGITESNPTSGNTDGINKLLEMQGRDFTGLCFVNLVDFDMKYGHRNDIAGYANAMHEWDDALGIFLGKMQEDDLLIITADHGCDPSTPSTDHSRETIPLLIYGEGYKVPHNMGELIGFGNIANIVLKALMQRDLVRPLPDIDNTPDKRNIASFVDLTNLKQFATEEDIRSLIDKAIESGCASVCIPPSYVKFGSRYARGRLKICTVIGFPNGYSTTAVKIFEACDAVDNGASEIDMVINLGFVKNLRFDLAQEEIKLIAEAVHAKGAILKVIIETCYLTEEEKIRMCEAVSLAGADFIKTSTGFGTAGATAQDVALMASHVTGDVKVKAAGGIRSAEAAKAMIDAGASRIGSSSAL